MADAPAFPPSRPVGIGGETPLPPERPSDLGGGSSNLAEQQGPSLSVGTRQWIRSCKADVAGQGLNLDNMQVQFMVKQVDQQHNNWAYCRITNLADKTAQAALSAAKGGGKIFKLEGGYQGRSGLIFEGEISQIRIGKEPNGVDSYCDVLAQSGKRAFGYATISKTLSSGATFDDIIGELAKAYKKHLVKDGFLAKLGGEKFSRAVVMHGMVRDYFRKYAQSVSASWSVQNQKLYVVKNGEGVPGMKRDLNANSGLIGRPEQTMQGIVAKVLLDPGFDIYQTVHVDISLINEALVPLAGRGRGIGPGGYGEVYGKDAQGNPSIYSEQMPKRALNGDYQLVKIEHDGTMEGQPWYTTLTMIDPKDESTGAQRARAGTEYERAITDKPLANAPGTVKAGPR